MINKVYYLSILVIIGLVVWLVIDIIENKTQAENIMAGFKPPPQGSVDIKPLAPPPPLPGDLRAIFVKVSDVVVPPPQTNVIPRPNFLLTGLILVPGEPPKAIILNPTNNVEKTYTIGDKIDDWEIIAITSEQVKFKNSQGEEFTLSLQKPAIWKSSEKPELPKDIKIEGIPQKLIDMVLSDQAPKEQVRAQIMAAVNSLPPEYARKLIEQYTGLSKNDMPADDKDLAGFAGKMWDVFQGDSPPIASGQAAESVSFALRVNSDNSPIAPQTVFRPGDRRIYACFPMQGPLAGLATIIHRWRNKNTGEIMRIETRPITPNATYNWTYLEKKEGWPDGEYEVELFKTQTMEKIAGGKFTIVP